MAFLLSLASFAQDGTKPSSDLVVTNKSTALSKIEVFDEYEKDSLKIKIECSPFEGKDAIEIRADKYRGLYIEFHRPMGSTMLKQNLEANHTGIDIKTIFSGTYYLDVYNAAGEKIKTFRVEKRF